MTARFLVLLLMVATPVTATTGKNILRNWVAAGCVVVLVTVALLLIMWKCIGHLKKRDENQALWSTSPGHDVEGVLPHGDQPSLQVISWPSSKTMGPTQVYPEVPPPTYSSLVFNKESPLKHNSQDVKPKVFMIAI